MRNFYTANLDTFRDIDGEFTTEPYEAAWAGEAIFFIRVDKAPQNSQGIEAQVQISIDGISWIDEGSRFENVNKQGDYFVKVSHFGGWLRLKGKVLDNKTHQVSIYLVLKE